MHILFIIIMSTTQLCVTKELLLLHIQIIWFASHILLVMKLTLLLLEENKMCDPLHHIFCNNYKLKFEAQYETNSLTYSATPYVN